MRICHVIYIPRFSGAEILVRSLAIAHQALGHQVAVMALMPPQPSFLSELAQMQAAQVSLFLPEQELSKRERITFLVQHLKQFKPDVVVAHAVIPSLYARIAVRLAALHHTSTLSVLHDASQDDYASPYFRALERWFVPAPDAIVAVSPTGAENYCNRINSIAKPVVIPNGINLSAIQQAATQRDRVRQTIFAVQPEEVVFLQVGRFSSTKQQHLSLQAFAQAQQQAPFSGKLCFVGSSEDQPYEQHLRQLAQQFNIEDQLLILGSRSDVPDLLSGADVFLMPSKIEAHSLAFIEALSSGIAIVASDIPSLQYGKAFPGVKLICPELINEFTRAIVETVRSSVKVRWQRDLSAYSVEQTSKAYLELFGRLSAIAS
ncbi:glycosyltransferase family 4 protein [Cyanobacteria bacterium FACHB-DQ100]|nr:glycosyltransferase family 4 protein [Cyanobacteria bacterium FACHB-DQ100]